MYILLNQWNYQWLTFFYYLTKSPDFLNFLYMVRVIMTVYHCTDRKIIPRAKLWWKEIWKITIAFLIPRIVNHQLFNNRNYVHTDLWSFPLRISMYVHEWPLINFLWRCLTFRMVTPHCVVYTRHFRNDSLTFASKTPCYIPVDSVRIEEKLFAFQDTVLNRV